MKRKLTALVIGVTVLFSLSVRADEIKTFYNQDGAILFDSGQSTVICCYDSDGTLAYSDMYTPESGVIKADIPKPYSDMHMRAYIENTGVFALEKSEGESALPTSSPEPKITISIEAAATPSPMPSAKSYPSVYPKETDAVNAFMVCEKVSVTQNADNEAAYIIQAFYQGKKTEVVINADAYIKAAPQKDSYTLNNDASALKKGDVFKLTYNIAKTRIKRIELIFRPDIKTIAYDNTDYGNNFEKLFLYENSVSGTTGWTAAQYNVKNKAKYKYAFGIIADKSSNTLSLMNKEGKTDDIMEIDLDKETVVYECNVSNKYEISPISISGITRTFIPKSLFYEDKITWTSSYDYSYALVRIINDTATDIAVFSNF